MPEDDRVDSKYAYWFVVEYYPDPISLERYYPDPIFLERYSPSGHPLFHFLPLNKYTQI